ncbi:MAG: CaiB/BaiF CoA transferase family protein [Ilumatobacteraceae bacterium]
MAGPLGGVRVIEIAGIGPGPFAAMMLADMGAEVIRVDRTQAVRDDATGAHWDVMLRGRRNIALDLKHPEGVETLLTLVEGADAIIEGFRPGVMERLGVGPDACMSRNPTLVFGRMTGWGQAGPYANAAGHDINYIALAGALAHFGRAGEPPTPPLNMVGDFGGGGMLLAFGVVCALLEAQRSGKGQVVDAAMVDGSAVLMSMFWAFKNVGMFDEHARGTNLLDTGAHFYDVFECADGEWVSIGSIEPQFYALLLEKTGITADADSSIAAEFATQMDRSKWPQLKERLAAVFRTKTREQWNDIMEGTDVCYAPVLRMSEAARHPHNVARETFIDVGGVTQPAPAPRYSRSTADVPAPPAHAGQHTSAVLADWGFGAERIDALIASGAARQLSPRTNVK